MIENPFILRGYISDAYFCDREKETIDLIREIKNGNNITLIAPRRIGKTGLVQHVYAQEEIKDKCPEELFTIIMRRFMMRCSERIAKKNGCGALITGESVGQVASQTMQAIGCTEAVVEDLPVFRPLIGMDKDEVIERARNIGTFETSILPYEDCCTVFTPKHPRTRPHLKQVEEAEAVLDVEALVEEAINNIKFLRITGE